MPDWKEITLQEAIAELDEEKSRSDDSAPERPLQEPESHETPLPAQTLPDRASSPPGAFPGAVVARRGDPWTSWAAARSVDPATVTATHRAILSLLDKEGPMTDERIALTYAYWSGLVELPKQSPSGLRTRRKELVDAGLVRDTGATARLATGRQGIVWGLAR